MLGLSHLGDVETNVDQKPIGHIRALEWPQSFSNTDLSTGDDEISVQEHQSVSHVSLSSMDHHSVTHEPEENCDYDHSIADIGQSGLARDLTIPGEIYGQPFINGRPLETDSKDLVSSSRSVTIPGQTCGQPIIKHRPLRTDPKGRLPSARDGARDQVATAGPKDSGTGGRLHSYPPLVPYNPKSRSPRRGFSSGTATHSTGGRFVTWPTSDILSSQMGLDAHISRARSRLTSYVSSNTELSIDGSPKALTHAIDRVRLRMLPHQGSPLDRILHRADALEDALTTLFRSLQASHEFLDEYPLLIRSCIKYLVQLAAKNVSSILEKAFEAFNEVTEIITAMGRPKDAQSPELDKQLFEFLIAFMDMIVSIFQHIHITGKSSNGWASGLETLDLAEFVATLKKIYDHFCHELWDIIIRSHPSKGISLDMIRRWLFDQEGESVVPRMYGACSGPGFTVDLPLKWMVDQTGKFWEGSEHLLLMTGNEGCGKSAICQFLLDQSRSRYPRGTRVLYFSFESQFSRRKSSLSFVKSLILQLLDQNNANFEMFSAICDVYVDIEQKHIPDAEGRLWLFLIEWATATTRAKLGAGTLIVVDNLDKVNGGKTTALQIYDRLYAFVSKHHGFRAVVLSRPIFGPGDSAYEGCWKIPEPFPSEDIQHYIDIRLRQSSRLEFLASAEMDEVVRRALDVRIESIQTANLAITFIELQGTYPSILTALLTMPGTRRGLIDYLIMRIDFASPVAKSLISWLAVAEDNLSISELQRLLDPAVVSLLASADASRKLREPCAFLVDIRFGSIAFIDKEVKGRILHLAQQSRIRITHSQANHLVLVRCLEYMKNKLQVHETPTPSLNGPGSKRDIKSSSRALNDPVLDYCIQFYIQHYISGYEGFMGADWKSVYPDTPQLAQWEFAYWADQPDIEIRETWHRRALEFRKAILGENSQAVIQSLINLAKLSLSTTHSFDAMVYLCEAWKISVSVMGSQAAVCKDLAQTIADIVSRESSVESSFDDIPNLEEILEYLWKFEQKNYDTINDSPMVHVQFLVGLYEHRRKFHDACRLLQDLYHQAATLFGRFDPRTIDHVERLIRILKEMGRDNEILVMCEDLFGEAEHTLKQWDQRRLKILFHMIACYLRQGHTARAQDRLSKIWRTLYELAAEIHTLDVHIALVLVTLERIQLFRYHPSKMQQKETSSLVSQVWLVLGESSLSFNDELLGTLLDMSEYCVSVDVYEPVLPILLHLQSAFHDRITTSPHDAIRVAIALSRCYRYDPVCKGRSEFDPNALQELLQLLLGSIHLDESYADLAEELVYIYISEKQWAEAIQVCTLVLTRLWPAILEPVDTLILSLSFPKEYQAVVIRMVLLYGRVKLLQSENDYQTSLLLQYIFALFRKDLPLHHIALYEAACVLSDCLRRLDRMSEAMEKWKELYEKCSHQLGPFHEQCLRITEYVLGIYRETGYNVSIGSIDVLTIILRSFPSRSDWCRSIVFEVIATLLSQYESQGRLDEMLNLYDQMWQAIFRYNRTHAHPVSDTRIFEIYQKFFSALKEKGDWDRAIQLTYELQKLLRINGDLSALLCLRADFELAELLERDDHKYKQVIPLYEAICETEISEFDVEEREEVRYLIQTATERLAKLYMSHADLAAKAEAMLVKYWRKSVIIHGSSDLHTLQCFHRLIEFRRHQTEGGTPIHTWIREYVMDLLAEERDGQCLFERAGSVAKLYRKTQKVSFGLRFMQELRGEIVSLSTSNPSQPTPTSVNLLDHRCLIFIDAVDIMLSERKRSPPLLEDLLRDVFAETALYEAWGRAKRGSYPLKLIFGAASRLFLFLKSHGRDQEGDAVLEDLWSIFQATSGDLPAAGIVRLQVEICIRCMDRRQTSATLVEALVRICTELFSIRSCSGGLVVLEWAAEYLSNPTWAKPSQALQLALRLAQSINRLSFLDLDRIYVDKAKALVSDILSKLIRHVDAGELVLSEISVQEVNLVIQLLGHGASVLKALKEIFASLWHSRHTLGWATKSTVSIGLRLCEVRFALDEQKEALQLLQDICYNIRDVYGPRNSLTIECDNLHARLLATNGQYDLALTIEGNIFKDVLTYIRNTPSVAQSDLEHLNSVLDDQRSLFRATLGLKGGWEAGELEKYSEIHDDLLGKLPGIDQFDIPSDGARAACCWSTPTEWTIAEDGPIDGPNDDLFDSAFYEDESSVEQHGPMEIVLRAQPCRFASRPEEEGESILD